MTGKEILDPNPKRGRPAFEVTDEVLNAVMVYASHGLHKKDIARCIGCSYKTFNKAYKSNKDFKAAYKRGDSMGIADVTSALYHQAVRGEGWAVKFALTNRRAGQWKEKPETQVDVNNAITIEIDETDARL